MGARQITAAEAAKVNTPGQAKALVGRAVKVWRESIQTGERAQVTAAYATARGFATGYLSPGKKAPKGSVTRDEFRQMFLKADGKPYSGTMISVWRTAGTAYLRFEIDPESKTGRALLQVGADKSVREAVDGEKSTRADVERAVSDALASKGKKPAGKGKSKKPATPRTVGEKVATLDLRNNSSKLDALQVLVASLKGLSPKETQRAAEIRDALTARIEDKGTDKPRATRTRRVA
jgi:hypothetical protein